MRRLLDGLYRYSGGLAAFFLLAICAIVLLQVGANLVDAIFAFFTGQAIGLVVPSYAEFAGFFLAASSFLALAYTLRHGGHIRVSLVLQALPDRVRRFFDLFAVVIGAALSGYFFYYTAFLVVESIEFGDVSPGMVPVALWLPQSAMLVGLGVLCVAFVDEFISQMKGGRPSYEERVPDWEESGE